MSLYHASASDPVWEYVNDEHVAAAHLAVQRQPLSFVGHSHVQLSYSLKSNDALSAEGGAVAEGTLVPLTGTGKMVVNPGAVGQPRDRNPRAAWALVREDDVFFRRVGYDIPAMQAAVRAAGLPAQIGERLELGW